MTTAGGFTYDPTTLSAASRDLASGAASVDAQLTAMSGRLEPLHQGFQGQAGSGFQTLWAEWHESAKRLKTSLDGLSQLLARASSNAAEMEQANSSMMRQS
ncbi:WXG100 family type VII secretion target [Klenkia sp. LSe6-5]|uniref:ESAT-6-like protein n=1 Tax=Klenkia sesuvii TaxID=3103137 RepID=A0ABU8DW52_9ACTN